MEGGKSTRGSVPKSLANELDSLVVIETQIDRATAAAAAADIAATSASTAAPSDHDAIVP